ncbi:MAG: hypothetical protein ISS48_04225 [Candidatus Aenigmarchaeota archaeon]|nr:hypothetical protein [Candidatus Aenigmarchaeota archaeon]
MRNRRNCQIEIVKKTVSGLQEIDAPMTISQISEMCNLHPETMKKTLEIIETSKNAPDFEIIKSGRIMIVNVKNRKEILEMIKTQNIRKFPRIDNEDIILIKMFNENAINPEEAIEIEDEKLTEKLRESFKIKKSGNKFFLTKIGFRIAKSLSKLHLEGKIY